MTTKTTIAALASVLLFACGGATVDPATSDVKASGTPPATCAQQEDACFQGFSVYACQDGCNKAAQVKNFGTQWVGFDGGTVEPTGAEVVQFEVDANACNDGCWTSFQQNEAGCVATFNNCGHS